MRLDVPSVLFRDFHTFCLSDSLVWGYLPKVMWGWMGRPHGLGQVVFIEYPGVRLMVLLFGSLISGYGRFLCLFRGKKPNEIGIVSFSESIYIS